MAHGSVVSITGPQNLAYMHAVIKEPEVTNLRISFVFRAVDRHFIRPWSNEVSMLNSEWKLAKSNQTEVKFRRQPQIPSEEAEEHVSMEPELEDEENDEETDGEGPSAVLEELDLTDSVCGLSIAGASDGSNDSCCGPDIEDGRLIATAVQHGSEITFQAITPYYDAVARKRCSGQAA
jgi:hypothetical protein